MPWSINHIRLLFHLMCIYIFYYYAHVLLLFLRRVLMTISWCSFRNLVWNIQTIQPYILYKVLSYAFTLRWSDYGQFMSILVWNWTHMQLYYGSTRICELQMCTILVFNLDVLQGLAPKHRLLSVDTCINKHIFYVVHELIMNESPILQTAMNAIAFA